MSETICFPSPAKLNLFLHITGVREDGYHNLQTLFQFVDVVDTLKFSSYNEVGPLRLITPFPGVSPEQNLITKAATLLRQKTGTKLGATIEVDKQLPMGGGLGGGSSNAATTLVALNSLWNTGQSEDELAHLGLTLGADVPVFVRGRTALAYGVGEILTPVEIPEPWYLILVPECQVPTAKLFSDKQLTTNSFPITMAAFIGGGGHNDFERIARKHYPLIDTLMQLLNRWGRARLTGTGACVFSEFSTRNEAVQAWQHLLAALPGQALSEQQVRGVIAQGTNISPLKSSIHVNRG